MERLAYVMKATETGKLSEQVFCAFLGELPREDFIPYVADFFLQLEDTKWTLIAGVVNGDFIASVRNIGYTRNAGEFMRKLFADIGSAGGHRAMAKAVVPAKRYVEKYGPLENFAVTERLLELALQFLHDTNGADKKAGKEREKEPVIPR